MDTRQQDQEPPPWGYHPPPPVVTYQSHYPHHQSPNPLPPIPHQQQQQPYNLQYPPPWPPTPADHLQYQYQTRSLPPGPRPPPAPFPPPPAPGPYNHGGLPRPYPGSYPHPPQPPSYMPAAPLQNDPPPSNQAWQNSSWDPSVYWEHPEKNISYNNEEDWAARARAWAEANSSTDNHHTPMQFMPVGRMEVHNQAYQEPFQQVPGPPADVEQPSFPKSQQLPVSMTAQHKQINHLEDPTTFNMRTSPHNTDGRTSYATTSEGQATEKGAAQRHVNFASGSSVFQQEVSSSYSSFRGKFDGDQQEILHTTLPSSSTSVHEIVHNIQPALPFPSVEQHHINRSQPTTSIVDASDQPLVFDQRFGFEHGQNQKINYSDMNAMGSLGVSDHMELPSSLNSWTPSIPFSHVTPVPSGLQHDSSSQTIPSVNVHPTTMFGRMPAPSFHPSIPPARAPFGLPSTAPHHLSGLPEDAGGTFNSVDRPKKASVPNWLREELLKKKAFIANSLQEQSTGGSYSAGDDDTAKSFGKGDWNNSKIIDSTRSSGGGDDDEEEGDVEAEKSVAINQEIKRILTDILLKVTDDLFEEIATKVIDEDADQLVEVNNNVSSKTIVSPVASAGPKSSAKVPVPVIGNSAKIAHAENSSSLSPKENILGLANYASDDDDDNDDETQDLDIVSSMAMNVASQEHLNHNHSSENMVKEAEGVSPEKIKEAGTGPRDRENGGKKPSKENLPSERKYTKVSSGSQVPADKSSKDAISTTGYGECSTKKADPFVSGHGNDPKARDSMTDKPDIEGQLAHEHSNGHFMSDEVRNARSKSFSTDRSIGKKSHGEVETGLVKVVREYSDGSEHRRGDAKHQEKVGMDKSDHLRRNSKDGNHLSEKNMEMSTSRKRAMHGNEKTKEYEEDKRTRGKEENKKRDQMRNVKEAKMGKGHRDSYRSKQHTRSPSPANRLFYSKSNSFRGHGGASSGEVSDDPRRKKSWSTRRSLSRSPPRSKRRQISRSPPTKHSQRRPSPYSYSDRRRKSRSGSPVQHRR